MKNKAVKLSVVLGVIALVLIVILSYVSFSNREIGLRNSFKQKIDERTAFYDKMWKTLSQKSQIAVKNDSSFYRNVNAIMAARKDAPQLFMKWVQESNPNANYDQVAILYRDLQNFDRKHFREFKYLTVEPPTWSIAVAYIISLALTIGYYRGVIVQNRH